MSKFTFAIMGATGNIGHHLTEELLKKGHKVRALGRDKRKLQGLKAKGAEILSGDITDSDYLAKAFKGCHAVFSLLPPGWDAADMEVFRDAAGDAIAIAVAEAKVSHVVNLSSIGAHLSSDTGPVKALHRQEQRLDAIPKLNVLHFRPGFFMENLMWFIPSIKSSGTIASFLNADLPIPMVATRDIGLKLAEFFDTLKFTGSSVFEFGGPKDVTMAEAAKIIGKAIGKPDLKYKHLSYEHNEKEMIASGMKHQIAKLFVDMYKAFNEKEIKPTHQLAGQHRGKTSLEEFAKTFSQMYNSAKKAA